ncbi:hypothetical protein SRB17_12130 [Streptomyces sp. RB17]|uniref:hypothetical protein n=1 Tax=Streptomyces sp. RB17 TaxID=2585197 RepID=UPI00130C3AC4|nr:hypothetical protein [Streptomyces sp. RB17]MQY33252.1 hypothetical protein [Streptomyces sp. RB17]
MTETWAFDGERTAVTAEEAVAVLRRRIAGGRLESWLTGSTGRLLSVLSNTERALVMLLDGEDDPGAHAVSADSGGASGGFRLANGQCDTYPDEDTVPLDEAFRIIRQVIGTGLPPTDTRWAVDS